MIEIIPAIDIIGGKCVRLSQGDYSSRKDYGGNPVECAQAFAECGVRRLHLVDLEGAKASEPKNLKTLEQIAALGLLTIEWGGGIKDDKALDSVWSAGADQAIIGSVAAIEPEKMESWLRASSPRIILGADVRNKMIAVSGWLKDSGLEIEELISRFIPCGLQSAIVTDISRDGMLQGPSFGLYADLQKLFPALRIVVSGGVSCVEDIFEADRLGLQGVIVGKAIYEKRITLDEIKTCLQKG